MERDVRPSARAVVVGLVLIAVPTAFSVFPEWTRWPMTARIGAMTGWTALAVAAVVGTARNEARVAKLVTAAERARSDVRELASERVLTALLRPPRRPAIPRNYELSVYLHDPATDLLLPVFPPLADGEDWRVFPPGSGATGTAWKQQTTIVALGDEVSDATYHLTDEQQRRFQQYRVVAATPISRENDERIGVLTAIARRNDGFFGSDAGIAALRELADVVGVVLDNLWDDWGTIAS